MHTRLGLVFIAVILLLAAPSHAAQADSPVTPPKWAILTPENISALRPIQVFSPPDGANEAPQTAGFDANSRLIALYSNYDTDTDVWRYPATGQVVPRL